MPHPSCQVRERVPKGESTFGCARQTSRYGEPHVRHDLPSTDTRVGAHVILPSDVRTKIAMRTACLVLLIPMVLFEMYLCTAFLPMQWQRAINDSLPDILPKSHDWTPITHPLLSEEIESVLREHVGLRITLFAITVALLLGNAWLIRQVWRFSGRTQTSSENR